LLAHTVAAFGTASSAVVIDTPHFVETSINAIGGQETCLCDTAHH